MQSSDILKFKTTKELDAIEENPIDFDTWMRIKYSYNIQVAAKMYADHVAVTSSNYSLGRDRSCRKWPIFLLQYHQVNWLSFPLPLQWFSSFISNLNFHDLPSPIAPSDDS